MKLLSKRKAILQDSQNLTMDDRERLFGYLGCKEVNFGRTATFINRVIRFTGLDGQKMSRVMEIQLG